MFQCHLQKKHGYILLKTYNLFIGDEELREMDKTFIPGADVEAENTFYVNVAWFLGLTFIRQKYGSFLILCKGSYILEDRGIYIVHYLYCKFVQPLLIGF